MSDTPSGTDGIPTGRVIRDPEDEGNIMMDFTRYGNAYVREPIPEWWGELGKYVNDRMMKSWDLSGAAEAIGGYR